MLWVGDGYWRDRLLKRVRSMGLQEQVITTGRVQPEAIPGYMHAMDLLVHPSWREGLPRAVPQALLSGVPVVAHDVDGTREIIVESETGLLVAPGDHDALRTAVLAMHDDPKLAARTAELGSSRAAQRFPADRMVDELEQLYASLLD